jgi:hypothetical protein
MLKSLFLSLYLSVHVCVSVCVFSPKDTQNVLSTAPVSDEPLLETGDETVPSK